MIHKSYVGSDIPYTVRRWFATRPREISHVPTTGCRANSLPVCLAILFLAKKTLHSCAGVLRVLEAGGHLAASDIRFISIYHIYAQLILSIATGVNQTHSKHEDHCGSNTKQFIETACLLEVAAYVSNLHKKASSLGKATCTSSLKRCFTFRCNSSSNDGTRIRCTMELQFRLLHDRSKIGKSCFYLDVYLPKVMNISLAQKRQHRHYRTMEYVNVRRTSHRWANTAGYRSQKMDKK